MMNPTTGVIKELIKVSVGSNYTTIQAIGLFSGEEKAVIEQPIVKDYDVTNDSHWTPVLYLGEQYVLNAENNCFGVPFRGVFRINKTLTSNNVGFFIK